jgi:hypothetical protein
MSIAAWSTQQLAEFLAVVSSARTEVAAVWATVERAAEDLDAEVAAIVSGDEVLAAVGYPDGAVPVVAPRVPATRSVSVARPGPLRSASACCRPARATSSASPGPFTSGPVPWAQSMSVATSRRLRTFAGAGRARARGANFSAATTRSSGTARGWPSARRMSW